MHPRLRQLQLATRRHFLRDSALGLGGIAAATLGQGTVEAATGNLNRWSAKQAHFPPKVKRIIYLHMTGSPPHLDLLDFKPELDCFTMWLAGGGVRRGITYGETDELGFKIAKDGVHVHDLQATILHLLGFDHERLIHRFQGRDYRLTDVHGTVVSKILA